MLARELISVTFPSLNLSDSVQKVLERMTEFRLSHMPVVEDGIFLGSVSDEQLVEYPDYSKTLKQLNLNLSLFAVYSEQHYYDVLRFLSDSRMTLVPVLNLDNSYIGVITLNTVIETMTSITAMKEQGAILVVEMTNTNSSLSHLSQIIESVNVRILSSYVTSFPDSTKTELTLKINTSDLSSVLSHLNRYNYNIISVFNQHENNSFSADRFGQLMNYLNI